MILVHETMRQGVLLTLDAVIAGSALKGSFFLHS